jgi:hypothetical protein
VTTSIGEIKSAQKKMKEGEPVRVLWYSFIIAWGSVNIPPCGYRESGKMETAVPAKWEPVLSPL